MPGSNSIHNLQVLAGQRYPEVLNFASLPPASLHPAEIYVVLSPTGFIITLNLKRAGLYLSDGVNWTRLGTLQEQFSTSNFVIFDGSDNTKKVIFDLTNITTGTTRTVTMPDVDIDLTVIKILNADGSIDFVPLSSVTHKEGRVYYDDEDKALSLKTDIVGSTQSLGQEFWVRVINKTGATISDGQVVYISGFDPASGRPTIALAKADVMATADAIGFATSTMADDAEGFVTTMGFLNDLDTSSFTDGDAIFLSDTVAGAITVTEPVLSVPMGFITNADVDGQLFTTISRDVSFGRASGVLHSSVTVAVGTTTISLPFDTNPPANPLKKVELIGGLGGTQIKSLIDDDVFLHLEPQFNRTSGGTEESTVLWTERSIDNGVTWAKELAIVVELKGGDTEVSPLTAILCCKNDRIRFRAQGTMATTLEFVAKAAGVVTSDHPIIPAYILTIS